MTDRETRSAGPGRPPRTTRQRNADELRVTVEKFARHLWDEATDRDRPTWPPAWLAFAGVGVALLVLGFIVLPLVSALVGAIAGWSGDGVQWLAAWKLTHVVTDPVRGYLDTNAGAIGVSGDLLWLIWLITGGVLLFLGLTGATGARVGWAVFGAVSAAMVWAQTPRPGQWLAVGVAAIWWSVLSVFAYRRRHPRPAVVVVPPPRAGGEPDAVRSSATLVQEQRHRENLVPAYDIRRTWQQKIAHVDGPLPGSEIDVLVTPLGWCAHVQLVPGLNHIGDVRDAAPTIAEAYELPADAVLVDENLTTGADTAFVWGFDRPSLADYVEHRPYSVYGKSFTDENVEPGQLSRYEKSELRDWAGKYHRTWTTLHDGDHVDVQRLVRRLARLRGAVIDALTRMSPADVRAVLTGQGLTRQSLPEDLADRLDLPYIR